MYSAIDMSIINYVSGGLQTSVHLHLHLHLNLNLHGDSYLWSVGSS